MTTAADLARTGPFPGLWERVRLVERTAALLLLVEAVAARYEHAKAAGGLLDFDDLVRLDFLYLERWSVGLDLAILLKTLPAVLTRRGAF